MAIYAGTPSPASSTTSECHDESDRMGGMAAPLLSRRAANGLLLWLVTLPAAAEDGEAKARLGVYVSGTLPNFTGAEAVKFVAFQMTKPYVGRWSFAPGKGNPKSAPDRVEWHFEEQGPAEIGLHVLSAELRLFLGGHYQTLVFNQATIGSDPDNTALAAFLVQMTQGLLGLNGAYHIIDRRWKVPP
jgi:hypothetical protein